MKIKDKKGKIKGFISSHNLIFEDGGPFMDGAFRYFRIGTITGLYGSRDKSYIILAIGNDKPGNGHLEDVFEWFEISCKRDGYSLQIIEIMNHDFKRHLIEKRGFKEINNGVEKVFIHNKT